MKKTLGAIALLGASARGCTAGSSESAEIRVWLVGTDTPQEARDYLVETFEADNPGSTLVIEEQSWDGLVDKLTTSPSSSDSPDIVEFATRRRPPSHPSVPCSTSRTSTWPASAATPYSPGFVEAGSYDGKFFAPPQDVWALAQSSAHRARASTAPATRHQYARTSPRFARRGDLVDLLRRPGLVQLVALHLGERRRDRCPGWRQLGCATVIGCLGRGGKCRTSTMNASLAPKDGDNAEPWTPYCENQAVQFWLRTGRWVWRALA